MAAADNQPIWAVLAGGGATLAGVALQSFINARRENRLWRWQRRTRWDERKLEICAEFLVCLHRVVSEISQYAVDLSERGVDPRDPEAIDRLTKYRAALDDLRPMVQQIRLTMSDLVIKHADSAYQLLKPLYDLACAGTSVHAPDWLAAHGAMDVERRSFRAEVRRELEIAPRGYLDEP
jgi:hypothetical protein